MSGELNLPLEAQLWDGDEVAMYLHRKPRYVKERLAFTAGFPSAVRLPSPGGRRGHRLWKATDIITWAMSQKGQ